MADKTRTCTVCSTEKPIGDFYVRTVHSHGIEWTGPDSWCKKCRIARNEGWWREHPDAARNKRRRRVLKAHGLTEDEYNTLLAAQGGVCAICRTQDPGGKSGLRFHIDHDRIHCPGYKCCGKCVRGLLCVRCNTGLGLFWDKPSLLRKAGSYVEEFRVAHSELSLKESEQDLPDDSGKIT